MNTEVTEAEESIEVPPRNVGNGEVPLRLLEPAYPFACAVPIVAECGFRCLERVWSFVPPGSGT